MTFNFGSHLSLQFSFATVKRPVAFGAVHCNGFSFIFLFITWLGLMFKRSASKSSLFATRACGKEAVVVLWVQFCDPTLCFSCSESRCCAPLGPANQARWVMQHSCSTCQLLLSAMRSAWQWTLEARWEPRRDCHRLLLFRAEMALMMISRVCIVVLLLEFPTGLVCPPIRFGGHPL